MSDSKQTAAIEEIKQKVKANLDIIHASNAGMATMIMNAYSGNPEAGLDFWGGVLQATDMQAQEAKKAAEQKSEGAPASSDPAIEAIKQEVKSRIEATYGPANAAMTTMMMNTYINSPEAGKLEFWQKVRESVGGEAAPLDPKRKQEFGDWDFVEDGDTITIVCYWGKTVHVDIPAEINGKPVTRIGESAMDRYDYINSVTIPDSVVTIDERAFKDRKLMRHLTIPDSIVSIGEGAFDGCNLLSLTLGKGLKTIGKYAFYGNQLTELVIPDNVSSIGENAFRKNFISKLTIGKGLTVIPDGAFDDNRFREAEVPLSIPCHITDIGKNPFGLNRYSRVVIPDEKISAFKSIAKEAFDDAKFVNASDYEKEVEEMAKAEAAKKPAKKIDEKSKIIDLNDDNPAPCGRGWIFASGVYTIYDWANVTVIGDNKKSGYRIVVAKGAKKVNITLQDAVIFGDTEPKVLNESFYRHDDKIPLQFLAPVTLWLKGKNIISTNTGKSYTQGKNFIHSGIGITCKGLTIAGTGSLEMTGSIYCDDSTEKGNIFMYSGKMEIYYGSIESKSSITINGGEISLGTQNEKDYSNSRMYANDITVNGGTVTAKSSLHAPIDVGNSFTINGGKITAINDLWSYDGSPPCIPAISCDRSEIEHPIIINGGIITASVLNHSTATAIGKEPGGVKDWELKDEERLAELTAKYGIKLAMSGGTLDVTRLIGHNKEGFFPSRTAIDEVTGGTIIEGSKQAFKKPDISPPAAPPELTPDIFEYVDERAGYKVINGFEMMLVKAGTFMMGATEDQGLEVEPNEKPAHQVTLSRDYYMCLYPVTQKQWTEIMGSNPARLQRNDYNLQTQLQWSAILGVQPSRFAGNDFYPVECVSHINAREFILALNKKTGKNFRLPTEAEWEFAARGGILSKGFMYAGSNDLKEVAARERTGFNMAVTPTATKDCNELGFYDMSGNVKEWVYDVKGDYTEEAKTDPTGPEEPTNGKIAASIIGDGITVRSTVVANSREIGSVSGGYDMPERIVRGKERNAARYGEDEHRKYSEIGFRLVLTAES